MEFPYLHVDNWMTFHEPGYLMRTDSPFPGLAVLRAQRRWRELSCEKKHSPRHLAEVSR
jgi:hypothetical protein